MADKIRINLLPPEIKEQSKKKAKQSLVNRISIGLLGLLIIITAGILVMTVMQSLEVNSLTTSLDQKKLAVDALKDREAVVRLLKDRIDTINQFTENRYQQGQTFNLLKNLIPTGINLTTLQVDKTNIVSLSGETSSTTSLENFFEDLTDPQKNEGKIASVKVLNLNEAPSGNIKFDLDINLKGAK